MRLHRCWLTFLCVLSAIEAHAAPISCRELATVDARRLVPLPVEEPRDRIPGLVQACIADPKEGARCEWQHHIYQDRWLADAGRRHSGTRLVVENRNHIMGSGAEDVLYLFRCKNGRVQTTYQRAFEYGVKLQEVASRQLLIRAGLWSDRDPHCCPSQRQQIRLTFNLQGNRFLETVQSVENVPQ